MNYISAAIERGTNHDYILHKAITVLKSCCSLGQLEKGWLRRLIFDHFADSTKVNICMSVCKPPLLSFPLYLS